MNILCFIAGVVLVLAGLIANSAGASAAELVVVAGLFMIAYSVAMD